MRESTVDVYRRQIVTFKFDPRTVRVNIVEVYSSLLYMFHPVAVYSDYIYIYHFLPVGPAPPPPLDLSNANHNNYSA